MNILLVNDDGYSTEGIAILRKKLAKYGRVVTIGPKHHMSACSISISFGRPQEVKEIEKDFYYMDGTPADCVAFGLSMLKIKFDLVISGCNDGWNISYDTLYSATLGGCRQALTYYLPAIAFSTERDFTNVEKYFDEVFMYIINNKLLEEAQIISVNFPITEEVKGIKFAELLDRKQNTYYLDKPDGYYAWRDDVEEVKNTKSDLYLLREGYVTITPLNKVLYNKELLSKWMKKK